MATVKANLPLMILGLLLVGLSLRFAPWPPNYQGAAYAANVSHQQRLLGRDAPQGLIVQRPPAHRLEQVFDGLLYVMAVLVLAGIVGLVGLNERNFLALILLGSLYGLAYSLRLGLMVGPQMAAVGFSSILIAALFAGVTSANQKSLADEQAADHKEVDHADYNEVRADQ